LSDDGAALPEDYYRRDQKDGVSPPDLAKECTYAEHIVHARGKRTQYTSVSLDLSRICDFGDCNYKLNRAALTTDGHVLVEHSVLLTELRRVVREAEKDERLRAARALQYAQRRKEGLVHWRFDSTGVARKDLFGWAKGKVAPYFTRL
jgi:hypothetical protein